MRTVPEEIMSKARVVKPGAHLSLQKHFHRAEHWVVVKGTAEVTVGSETRKVRARDADGDERDRLWRSLADVYPSYDKYAQKTTRRIPVVVLEPINK